MSFQIHALDAAPFAPLFQLDDAALRARGGRRVVADAPGAYPCRVSLADAAAGETLVLVNYEHQPTDGPYRSRHAVYVRQNAEKAVPAPDTVPEVLRRRLLSVRAFDDAGMIRAADVLEGEVAAAAFERMLGDREVAYLHVHFAKPGCFAASVTRSG